MTRKRHYWKVLLVGALLLVPGCGAEKTADVEDATRYSKDGISFSHPGNWSVTEDTAVGESRYLFLESPGDALLSVMVSAPPDERPLREKAGEMEGSRRSDLPRGFTATASTFTRTRANLSGSSTEGWKESFTISAQGESVPHHCYFFEIRRPDKSVVLFCQVAVEDEEMVKPGFDLVLETLQVE